jgi:hypothetical protein
MDDATLLDLAVAAVRRAVSPGLGRDGGRAVRERFGRQPTAQPEEHPSGTCPGRELPGSPEWPLVWFWMTVPGRHPVRASLLTGADRLLGWVAPSPVGAVGVLATARCRPVTEGRVEAGPEAPGAAGQADAAACRMLIVVRRDGVGATRLQAADGQSLDSRPTGGALLDVLQRCLSRPTAVPSCGAHRLAWVLWLATAVTEAKRGRSFRCWEDLVSLWPDPPAEPAVGRNAARGTDVDILSQATSWTWEGLRRAAVAGRWRPDGIDPGLAAWMDDGIFSRVLLAGLPSLEQLMGALEPELPAALADRLRRILQDPSLLAARSAPGAVDARPGPPVSPEDRSKGPPTRDEQRRSRRSSRA